MNQLKEMMEGLVGALIKPNYAPVLKNPSEVGLEYEEVTFNAPDGVKLNAWFIPANSNKVIICNHFSPGNRYGYPGHLEEFNTAGGFEVNFLPKYKALHDAGYNVLTYDIRNHGESEKSNDGITCVGALEYQDVIGSIQYIKDREDTKDMIIGLQSNCMGADATFIAIEKMPELFKDIKALVAVQPLSGEPMIERIVENAKLGSEMVKPALDAYDAVLKDKIGFGVDRFNMPAISHNIKMPTLLVQVKEDLMTKPYDMENIYKNLGTTEKDLLWIEGTPFRFHGYTYFSEKPQEMISWFDRYMS